MSKGLLYLSAATALAMATSASAQGAPPPADTGQANAGVQDIVVTAQRRAQNLLTVPLSISAATGQQLQNQGIKEITSLQFTTPGFLPENGVGYVQIYIRGIGNGQYVGTGPSVTTYIDDVPRIFSSQVNTFADVERVEVLKGAQGGLYGYNSTGGVINIITKQPSDKAEAEAHVSYGTMHTLDAKAYVNVPLSDHIAWNFAVTRESHGDYIKNTVTDRTPYTGSMFPTNGAPGAYGGTIVVPSYLGGGGQATANIFNSGVNPPKGLGNQNFWAGESKLRLQATDNLKIILAGDYSKKHDSEGDQWVLSSGAANLQSYIENVFFPYVAGIYDSVTTGSYGPQTCTVQAPCKVPATNLPPGFITDGTGKGKWKLAAAAPGVANLVDYGGSAKVEWTLPDVTLTSISAYRAQHTLYMNDSGADSVPLVVPDVWNHKWYWYQEFRAVSTGSGPFHFVAGGNYLREHVHYNTVISYFNILPGAVTDSNADNHNWSIYAQVGYDLTSKLNLTVSGRYVSLKDQAVFDSPLPDPSLPFPAPTSATQANTKFLPSATLSYKTSGGVIYARYAKGFKEGGINPVVPPADFVDQTDGHISPGFRFGPEQVDTYEIGARGKLFGNKVQYTSAVFYNRYKGLQAGTSGDADHPLIEEAIINAGSARTWGVEGSITWRVIRPLVLGVNAGYLNAKYTNYKLTDSSTGLAPFDFDGDPMIYAPKLQAGITADLDQPINDRLRLVGNVLVSHISRVIEGESPVEPWVVQPGYWLTNLRIGVRTTDDHFGFSVYVNNLFNKYYTTFGDVSGLNSSQVEGDPRIIGGEFDIKF